MSILDIFRVAEIKDDLARATEDLARVSEDLARVTADRDQLKAIVATTGRFELVEIKKQIQQQQGLRDSFLGEIDLHKKTIERLKTEVVILDDELLIQSFGLYKPKYPFNNSAAYKIKLDVTREKQASMVRARWM